MATTKKTSSADENKVETPIQDNKPKMVKIRLPLTPDDNEPVFVSVNDYNAQIQRGVEVEVPDYVAEAIEISDNAKYKNLIRLNELAK